MYFDFILIFLQKHLVVSKYIRIFAPTNKSLTEPKGSQKSIKL